MAHHVIVAKTNRNYWSNKIFLKGNKKKTFIG